MKFAPLLLLPLLYYNQTTLNAHTELKAKTALIEQLKQQTIQNETSQPIPEQKPMSAEAHDYAHVAHNHYYLSQFLKGSSICTVSLGLMVLKDGALLTIPLSIVLFGASAGLYSASYFCKKISDYCDNCSHN